MNAHDKQDWELAKQISKDPTFKENVGKYGIGGALILALSSNSAFALDASAVTGKIDEAGTFVDTVGLALLGVFATLFVLFLAIGMLRRA